MGTKNDPSKFDCYNNAEPDEPYFVLLGRDRHAPALVLLWAILREREGKEDKEVTEEARNCAMDMAEWAEKRSLSCVALSQLPGIIISAIYNLANLTHDDIDNLDDDSRRRYRQLLKMVEGSS